jgi:hypothetical protein
MAHSPSHKFGQIIGDVLEAAISPLLSEYAKEHNLYFDKKGKRPARKGAKVCWKDLYGNEHDLDFVLEKNGSNYKIGTPVAFIESAWRRYTKHSRNKAQEIQGAIMPLATTHHRAAPFIGIVVSGEWTNGALSQLKSLGFVVLYFPLESVTAAFKTVGIDASFGEDTPDAVLDEKVHLWDSLSKEQQRSVAKELISINAEAVKDFLSALNRAVTREIELIRILPLHGTLFQWASIEEAINFIKKYDEDGNEHPVDRYEVEIRYNNGDNIKGQFADKEGAIEFLQSYQGPVIEPVNR